MADGVKPSELPLPIQRELSWRPRANALHLAINRKIGSLDAHTYVYAGKLPLRIENRVSDRPPASALPLAIDKPHATTTPPRYVSSKALPLAISLARLEQPPARVLPLRIYRELHTAVVKQSPSKPKQQGISLEGWESSGFGGGSIRSAEIKVLVAGFDSFEYGQSVIYAEVAEGYFPSNRLKLPIAVSTELRPSSSELPLAIHREHGQWLSRPVFEPTNRKYIYPKMFVAGVVSAQTRIELSQQYALPKGVDSLFMSTPDVKNSVCYIAPNSWQSSSLGAGHSLINRNQRITTKGFVATNTGNHLAYNLTQYRYLSGFDASRYGTVYLQGGVKYLSPQGYDASIFGKTQAINTTADQTVKPEGVKSLVMPSPTVTPRILYPSGFYNNGVYTNGQYETIKFGTPDVRDPAIKPLGETHTTYGNQTVWFHTRPLSPNGILSYQSGYPRVADPTQFIDPPSLLTSAIFGDTATRNLSFLVKPASIYDGAFSDYTTLTNSNRYYTPKGIDSLAVGAVSIANKTPSIFVSGITHYDTGTPAIGHAIRFIVPTGFDHLLFGRAVLTKTPELKTIGHQSSVIGQAWISHKNRTIDLIQKGINSFKAGEPTVWYGQRPVKTLGWQTASYGNPILTHEVREVLGQGFERDAYGIPWVSFGTRSIEPTGIYKDFPSNHMVGGTQAIKPAGYEATLWGERIIPISQSIQPLGFRESWGNATVDLHTKYIAPVGYISVGQQPADRWGDITVYNKLQYIVQEFDVNSGLVPPKWSDWTAIANRNIQMNVTGFASQRFGYSQVDNNAAPLLPNGIEPPVITIGMVSHGVRTVAPEAIEAPLISTWSVVHNDARVIAPLGYDSAAFGADGTVINTRREYRNVGRIDSLETGTPMIAYAIRTIDIEPRYSIAPPQINLPTVDLHTRYVSFRGYETTKYGLPSLSIHFNIIGPSWRHRDDFGYGAVRNNTPELQVGAFDSQEFGRASIRTQWRHVQAQGDTATLFGSAMIADTKQQIGLRGWQDSIISQLHTVTKTGTPPYTTQNIWLQNESKPWLDGFGIKPTSEPSRPGLNQNVLYARGFIATKFGESKLHSNNLYIDIGISIKNFGAGTAVANQRRYIDIGGIDNSIQVSRPVLNPHTIWATTDTPSQAVENHKGASFHRIDYYIFEANGRSQFGKAVVNNQHRTIYPRAYASSKIGDGASLDLHTRYIEPPTIRGFAMGFPEIPFTTKTINLNEYGFNSARYGSATLSRPPYTGPQTVVGRGFNNQSYGNNRVELLHRQLYTSGHNSLAMGTKLSNDKPFMWQGLRVGELVPMSIGAGDTSLFGDTRIGLRVREIPVEGFVAFRSEYEPARFKDRMKVTRSNSSAEDNLIQSINAMGINSEAIGAIETKWGQQFIRPDGNSDQFRKGGYHA